MLSNHCLVDDFQLTVDQQLALWTAGVGGSSAADSREDARRLMRERGEADSNAASARLHELNERLGRQIDEAEKRIARQRDDVMAGLEQMARDIGQDVYGKLSGQAADANALAGKVAAAMKGANR